MHLCVLQDEGPGNTDHPLQDEGNNTNKNQVAACQGTGQLHLLRNFIRVDNDSFEEVVKTTCLVHGALLS